MPNGKRSRNRPGRGGHRPQFTGNRNQTFDSSGPEGKVRGTANQVYEKYLALARDASSSGDRVSAENFFQHAEHYFRIMVASGQQMRPRPMNGFEDGMDGEGAEGGDGMPYLADQPQPHQPQPHQGQPHQGQPQQGQPHQGGGQPHQGGQPRHGQGAPRPQQQSQPQAQAAPAAREGERRPETPAELAQAAAANAEDRDRGRRPARRGDDTSGDA